jgi:hypothetical protein
MSILYRKFSLYEILNYLIPFSGFISVLYIIYLQNEQIKVLHNQIEILSKDYNNILELLAEKGKETLELKHTIKELIVVSQQHNSVGLDPMLVATQNDMIKFYITIAGGVALCLVGIYLLSNISGAFSLKKMIPASVYSIIQDYTPFCQTKKTLMYTDDLNKLDIIANIINDKSISIDVKDSYTDDFISLAQYISKLQSSSVTIIPCTDNTTSFTLFTEPTSSSTQVIQNTAEIINNLSSFI